MGQCYRSTVTGAVGRSPWGVNHYSLGSAHMKVLVTGGAGYIGSVIASALEEYGHVPILLDSLLNGPRVFTEGRIFYPADIADRAALQQIVGEHPDLECTIHCAARIVVPESVDQPYEYYRDNLAKSLELFDELAALGKPRVVFSSSASLYATSPTFEVAEDSPLAPTSPYARTKQVMEMALTDMCAATDLRAIIFRYFNPIGSDPRLRTGIYDRLPSHVLGQLVAAAHGEIDAFAITGTEYPTRDGSGLRDYVHVWDIARAHVMAVEQFDQVIDAVESTSVVINLGSENGTTVLELVESFERVYGSPVPKRTAPPRPGDAVGAYANSSRAAELLGWKTELSLDEAIRSALDWGERRREVLGYP
jgi:UDP-glucose 4-epimerase